MKLKLGDQVRVDKYGVAGKTDYIIDSIQTYKNYRGKKSQVVVLLNLDTQDLKDNLEIDSCYILKLIKTY